MLGKCCLGVLFRHIGWRLNRLVGGKAAIAIGEDFRLNEENIDKLIDQINQTLCKNRLSVNVYGQKKPEPWILDSWAKTPEGASFPFRSPLPEMPQAFFRTEDLAWYRAFRKSVQEGWAKIDGGHETLYLMGRLEPLLARREALLAPEIARRLSLVALMVGLILAALNMAVVLR